MNKDDFKNWLKIYGQAWEDKNSERFSELFSNESKYYWTPFEESKNGKIEIKEAFIKATQTQENIKFGYDVILFDVNKGICRWWCKFIRTSSLSGIKLDGIFICDFDKNNLCKIFREWWHKDGE